MLKIVPIHIFKLEKGTYSYILKLEMEPIPAARPYHLYIDRYGDVYIYTHGTI